MSIKIGDNNKLRNCNIIDNTTITKSKSPDKFNEKHPIITALLISILAGVIVLFRFWQDLINYIEHFF